MKLSLIVGSALAAACVSLAGPALAHADTGGNPGGLDPVDSVNPVAVSTNQPAAVSAPNTGGSAATADAKAGPGGAGSSRPASAVCTQDASQKREGATVNATGTQAAYSHSATDGTVSISAEAVPQFKVQPAALAVPSS